MKLEEANRIWNERDETFEINGHVVSKHKITDMLQSAEAIITASDTRIAELEKNLKWQKDMHEKFVYEAAREMSDSVSMAQSVQENFMRVQTERDDARKDAVCLAIELNDYIDSEFLNTHPMANEIIKKYS